MKTPTVPGRRRNVSHSSWLYVSDWLWAFSFRVCSYWWSRPLVAFMLGKPKHHLWNFVLVWRARWVRAYLLAVSVLWARTVCFSLMSSDSLWVLSFRVWMRDLLSHMSDLRPADTQDSWHTSQGQGNHLGGPDQEAEVSRPSICLLMWSFLRAFSLVWRTTQMGCQWAAPQIYQINDWTHPVEQGRHPYWETRAGRSFSEKASLQSDIIPKWVMIKICPRVNKPEVICRRTIIKSYFNFITVVWMVHFFI